MSESARLKKILGSGASEESYQGKQGPDYMPGVSAETVGSRALWLGSGDAPSSRRAYQGPYPREPRVRLLLDQRRECGSVHGRGARASGRRPRRRLLLLSGGVPHVAVNRGERPAVFVGARTDPNEQESVVMRPELDEKVLAPSVLCVLPVSRRSPPPPRS